MLVSAFLGSFIILEPQIALTLRHLLQIFAHSYILFFKTAKHICKLFFIERVKRVE